MRLILFAEMLFCFLSLELFALTNVMFYECTAMRAEEMNEYGKLVFKLAVLHDLFEIGHLANRLRETTEFDYTNQALSNYLKKRRPPEGFSDQLRRALNLNQDMYNLLLYVQDKTTGSLTPMQRERTEAFERMLLRDAAGRFLKDGGGAAN